MVKSRFLLMLGTVFVLAACHDVTFHSRYQPGEIDIYDDLFSVSVVDADFVVASGYHGSIYITSDGGKSWAKQNLPTVHSIYGVSMADRKHGWAVGQRGTILYTKDGGTTWKLQENAKQGGPHLFGVHAIDANTALVVGEWGSRLRTEDAGLTWEDLSMRVTLTDADFPWLSSENQEIVKSGGLVPKDTVLNNITCLRENANQCWIVGEFGRVFFSTAAG